MAAMPPSTTNGLNAVNIWIPHISTFHKNIYCKKLFTLAHKMEAAKWTISRTLRCDSKH